MTNAQRKATALGDRKPGMYYWLRTDAIAMASYIGEDGTEQTWEILHQLYRGEQP